MSQTVDKKFKRGFGCMVRELIAWIVPGSPTATDILPQTIADLCHGRSFFSLYRCAGSNYRLIYRSSTTNPTSCWCQLTLRMAAKFPKMASRMSLMTESR